MDVQIESKVTRHINRTSIPQQSAFWSEVKRKQGIASRAFALKIRATEIFTSISNRKNYVVDDLLVLFQDIGWGYRIGYVPYGPTIKPSNENQGLFLEELSESLRPFLPPGCVLLRYYLLWNHYGPRMIPITPTRGIGWAPRQRSIRKSA